MRVAYGASAPVWAGTMSEYSKRAKGSRRKRVSPPASQPMSVGDSPFEASQSASVVDAPNGGSQPAQLLTLAARLEFFHSPAGRAYVTLPRAGHEETHPLRSAAFREYLLDRYYRLYKRPAGRAALDDALSVLEARARFEGEEHEVHVRVGEKDGKLYIDLGNANFDVVEIDSTGWRIVNSPDVKFFRPAGMLPLPKPVRGADGYSLLRSLLHVGNPEQLHLIIGWLLGALRPQGPYAILNFHGAVDSAKTTNSRSVRSLIDPNVAPLRGLPKGDQDLMIAAANNWIPTLENVSSIPEWLSDALCRLSTGGGYGARRLYSDDEEAVLIAQRPIILNGIEPHGLRSDLIDRSIIIDLPRISNSERRTDAQMLAKLQEVGPGIMGWLCGLIANILSAGDLLTPTTLPRLADFAAWIAAAEPFLGWPPGHFEAIYRRNRDEANQLTLDACPIGRPTVRFAQTVGSWCATATDLLVEVRKYADKVETRNPDWPRSPKALSEALRRITKNLQALGIEVSFRRESGGNRDRLIKITSTARSEL